MTDRTNSRSHSATVRGQSGINCAARALLATPVLHRTLSGRLLTIEVIGRKTGRTYRVPVGYVRTPEGLLIGTAGRWRRNLGSGGVVKVRLERRWMVFYAEVVTDLRQCARYYAHILPSHPMHGQVAGLELHPDGSVCLDSLARALDRGIAVVRLMPASEQPVADVGARRSGRG